MCRPANSFKGHFCHKAFLYQYAKQLLQVFITNTYEQIHPFKAEAHLNNI
jgi:hypothetical protein